MRKIMTFWVFRKNLIIRFFGTLRFQNHSIEKDDRDTNGSANDILVAETKVPTK